MIFEVHVVTYLVPLLGPCSRDQNSIILLAKSRFSAEAVAGEDMNRRHCHLKAGI